MKRMAEGVTLIELLIVVLILAALAAVAVPRITQSATNAKQNACDTNVDLINSSIEMYFLDEGAYPRRLRNVTQNTTYFPDEEPRCPVDGGRYIYDRTTNRVTCDH